MWYRYNVYKAMLKKIAENTSGTSDKQIDDEKFEEIAQLDSTSLIDEMGKNWESRLAKYHGLIEFLDKVREKTDESVRKKIGEFYGILRDEELKKLDDSYKELSGDEIDITLEMVSVFYNPTPASSRSRQDFTSGRGMAFISVFKSSSNNDPLREVDEKFYEIAQKGIDGGSTTVTPTDIKSFRDILAKNLPDINNYRRERGEEDYVERRNLVPIVELLDRKIGKGKYKITLQKGAWYNSATGEMITGEGGFTIIDIDLKTAVEIGVEYDQWAILYAKGGRWWWIPCQKALDKFNMGATEADVLRYFSYDRPREIKEKKERGEKVDEDDLPRGDLLIPIFKVGVLEVFPEASGATYIPTDEGGVGVKAVGKGDIERRKQDMAGDRVPVGGGDNKRLDSGEAAAVPKSEHEEPAVVGPKEVDLLSEEEYEGFRKKKRRKEGEEEEEKEKEEEEMTIGVSASLKRVVASVVDEVLDWDRIESFIDAVKNEAGANRKVSRFIKDQIRNNKEEILATIYEKLGGKLLLASKGIDHFHILEEFGVRLASKLGYENMDPADAIYEVFMESLWKEPNV
jgi:hypothetical protein